MAATASLTVESSLARRLWAWSLERFPPGNAVLFVVLYGAALLYGRVLAVPAGAQVPLMARDAAGLLATVGFFLMLRVFDEHKDYALDLKNHPQRVLQSGLITLGHLKVVGALAIAVQLAVTLWQAHAAERLWGPATQAWLAVMVWSTLMAKEFFIGAWLEKRLVLYAISHMLVMPLAMVWLAQLGAPFAWLPRDLVLLAGLGFVAGFSVEIARKTRAPADERPTVDSYTKSLGLRGAPLTVIVLAMIEALIVMWMLRRTFSGSLHPAWWAVPAAIVALPTLMVSKFISAPSARAAKKIEAGVGLALVASFGAVIAAALVARGVEWL